MARLLSVAENYSLRSKGMKIEEIKEKEIFGFYDTFESGKEKSIVELRLQFMFEIEVFRLSYEDFIHKYKNYEYPENLSKEEILKYLNMWKNFVNVEEQKLYETIIKIFSENLTSESYSNEIRELEKNKENVGLCDPLFLINTVPNLRNFGDKMMENIEKEIIENGKFHLKLKLRRKNIEDIKLNKIKNIFHKIKIKKLNNKNLKNSHEKKILKIMKMKRMNGKMKKI